MYFLWYLRSHYSPSNYKLTFVILNLFTLNFRSVYSLGKREYSNMVYYYPHAHPPARPRPPTHHPSSYIVSQLFKSLAVCAAASAAAAAATLLRLLPLLELAAASHYHTTLPNSHTVRRLPVSNHIYISL